MDKLSKSILKFMSSKDTGLFCSIDEDWDSEADIPLHDLLSAVGAGKSEVCSAISFLVEHNRAEYRTLTSRIGPIKIAFRLKHEGTHYKEFARLTAKEKWLERLYGFVSGVIMTVLAGLIVSALSR